MTVWLGDYALNIDADGLCIFSGGVMTCFPYTTLAVLAFLGIALLAAAALAVSRFRWRREKRGD